jgi:hypothetical protein
MERVPSANLVDVIEVGNHSLTFHKRSNDGSSKCNLHHTGRESDSVFGAIYKISRKHKITLDRFEGRGYGYTDNQIILQHQGKEYPCFTYLAQQTHIVDSLKPYHWYKKLVVMGAKYLKFPHSYTSTIDTVESVEDPEEKRRKEKEILIEKIANYR